MADSVMSSNARFLWVELHAILQQQDAGRFGQVIADFDRAKGLDAKTVADMFLILDNPNQLGWQHNGLIRERLRVLLDTKLAAEQIQVQRDLAASNDRLGNKMYWLAWAGVAVAGVGVIVAIAQFFEG